MSHIYDAVERPGMLYVVEVSHNDLWGNLFRDIPYLHSRPMPYRDAKKYQEQQEKKGLVAKIITWGEA